ncbi:MarR family transcriptional regulator [Streptomyces sp. CC224B]|uniref:MarR family winged helix-turn-helix transcriptional regulator n=1 Tax=Streptomyces sp. CC224B TaxID=3044571 RepID=UPI0024A7C484|nr:MarR family transcriptional regulator [Streptomyces sp. CC224B]
MEQTHDQARTASSEAARRGQQHGLLEGLRIYGADYADMRRLFARWLDLHATDAAALIEVANCELREDLLTPARLSERIQLSPNATSALLNRMEQTGHILRTREHTDRRVVTLRAGEQARLLAEQFFTPVARRTQAVIDRYPAELVEQFQQLLDDLHHTMRTCLTEAGKAARTAQHPDASSA